jgi:protein-disulfide isomerase
MSARGPDQPTRTRLYQLGGLIATAVAIAAVLIAVLSAGSTSELAPGKPVPGAAATLRLFAGIPQHGAALGDPKAPVTLVEFGDLQCPTCASFATHALPAIVARYVRSGRVQIVFDALDFIGADSRRAALTADALAQQGRLWQFAELAFSNQGLENSGYATDTYLRALASAIPGVDVAQAMAQRSNAHVQAQLDQAKTLAKSVGVKSTPSFLLGRGGQPLHRFSPPSLDSGAFAAAFERVLSGGHA